MLIPQTKEALEKQLSRQVLNALWNYSKKDNLINSLQTLPLAIPPKAAIYEKVAKEYNGKYLKLKQTTQYAKTLMTFYKVGIQKAWNNHSELSKFKKEFALTNGPKNLTLKYPLVVKEMANLIYMSQVENRTQNSKKTIVSNKEVQENLFAISRAQLNLLKRAPSDFAKLPMFAVICLIFVEMTPLLCLAFPEITPSTCILPSVRTKLYKNVGYKLSAKDGSRDALSVKTAYNLPSEVVRRLATSLRLVSRYIPVQLYPESLLRTRLQDHYNYLVVDNYYLRGLNLQGNLWDLTDEELTIACYERNLAGGSREEMLSRLFVFLTEFENVGYLAVDAVVPPVAEWRSQNLDTTR